MVFIAISQYNVDDNGHYDAHNYTRQARREEEKMMEPQEFTALQVMVVIRTHQGGGPEVREFFDSTPFQYQFQDALGKLVKDQLGEARVEFNEVIISFDAPAQKAKKVQKKSSFMGRLFGE